MGIINVTADSFSADGVLGDPAIAVELGRGMEEAGADIVDVGGMSSRPGHQEISLDEELTRVMNVVPGLRAAVAVPISIDTYRYEVAQAAVAGGATIINDIWGLQREPRLAELAAQTGSGLVLMHNQDHTTYEDLVPDIIESLGRSVAVAESAGVPPDAIIVDPGIGFGKSAEQNLEVLRRLDALKVLGLPILLGTSRKSTIGRVLGLPVEDRLEGTAATVALGIAGGADIVRVHDVGPMVRVARMSDAVVRGGWTDPGGGGVRAYLALGSNLGEREANLEFARTELPTAGVHIVAVSSVEETEPVGGVAQPMFLNQVLEVDTDHPPGALLRVCKEIESRAGRRPGGERWGPRELDIDILLYGHLKIDSPELQIPHPELVRREFLLRELHEINPRLTDALPGVTVQQLDPSSPSYPPTPKR